MLEVGQLVPDLPLLGNDGRTYHFSDFKGKKIIFYFYPKDSTPGCTSEACSLNENLETIEANNAVVIGVSKDSIKSHLKFREKYGLKFLLVSDENLALASAFGVWQEKKLYGKLFMGVARSTFIIDETGRIAHVYNKVKVKTHGKDVIDYLT